MYKKLFLKITEMSQIQKPDLVSQINFCFNNDDLIFLAKLGNITAGYLIFDKRKNQIKKMFISKTHKNSRVIKKIFHTLIFLFPNANGPDQQLFYEVGFKKMTKKILIDPTKIDLIESPYIVKYKRVWYNTYSGIMIEIKTSEIKKHTHKLFELGFFIPSKTDFVAIFNYFLESHKTQPLNSSSIITTKKCNLSCQYCFEKNKQNSPKQIKLGALWDKIQPKIKDKFKLNFFGGEPTLNKEAIFYFTKKLREYTKEKGYKYSLGMITNGTLCNNNFCDFFKDEEFSHIQITLDGPKEIHNRLRGYFDEILHNSLALLRICKTLGIRINVAKYNYKQIPKLLTYLNNFYTKNLKNKIALSLGFVYDKNQKINISKTQYEKLYKFLEKSDFWGFAAYRKPKIRVVICAASIGTPNWFDLENNEYICEHLVGNENVIHSNIYLPQKCIPCKYYPICGGQCWDTKTNCWPIWPNCIRIKSIARYYIKTMCNKKKREIQDCKDILY